MKQKNACIVGNLHSLLLYLLYAKEDDIDKTFFFFNYTIPDVIVKNLGNSIRFNDPRYGISEFLYILKIRFFKLFKYRFLSNLKIFGQDNLLLTSLLLGNNSLTLLEEGLMNYTYVPCNRRFSFMRKIFQGTLFSQNFYGYNTNVNKIILTGMQSTPSELLSKVQVVNMNSLWNSSSKIKKDLIKHVFGIEESQLNKLHNIDSVLFTQPLSEDYAFSEEDKILLYQQLTRGLAIAIKPHPRERTDYSLLFPDSIILPSHIPIELLSLLNIQFKNVYTIFSSSVFSLPYETNVVFWGTGVHQALVERFGRIEMEDGKLKGTLKYY